MNIIYNDDCFNIFSKIVDKSINLVCVDLPYSQTNCTWDSLIDLNKMWIELKRIGKDNCQYVFFCTTKFGNKLINSNPKWFRYDIVWEKENSVGFLNSNKQPLRKHEMIYIFHNDKKSKDLSWVYNAQKTEGKPYKRKENIRKAEIYGRETIEKPVNNTGDRYPSSIIKYGYDKKKQHPTQKPVLLCEWIIKTYSNEGDTILDFTMGSGSTIVSCINTKRNYIGIEKDKDIFIKTKKRIEEHIII